MGSGRVVGDVLVDVDGLGEGDVVLVPLGCSPVLAPASPANTASKASCRVLPMPTCAPNLTTT